MSLNNGRFLGTNNKRFREPPFFNKGGDILYTTSGELIGYLKDITQGKWCLDYIGLIGVKWRATIANRRRFYFPHTRGAQEGFLVSRKKSPRV